MSRQPLNVAFVWHMHQPFYKDLVTGEYILPWVRLHSIKDYYDMVAILDGFPNIKQTFNMVPSLLEQIKEYAEGTAMDRHLSVTLKDASELTQEDKVFMLQNFFMANWETMVYPFKRYHELLLKRGRFVTLEEIRSVAKRFTQQELTDLQVWFNLTWFGNIYKTKDPVVSGLLAKGRDFSQEDKSSLMAKQKELILKVMPKYKEMQAKGQIEVSVTPFYHPILPLLIDTNSAKEALPAIKLPEQRFRHPEDAQAQVLDAVSYYKEIFAVAPSGMWPSEGSVSEEMIPLVRRAGIKWIATDEAVLSMSLGRRQDGGRAISSEELFKPYLLEREDGTLNIIFRDHNLSDLIGFTYSKWDPRDAAGDFMMHLHNIRASLPDNGKNYLVSIILDGENAWEHYRNNGWDFLSELYKRISDDPNIKAVRVNEYLEQCPPDAKLGHLFAGSWINHNFRIWIGHDEDNMAWDHLTKARLAIENSKAQDKIAWKELYIAEGSDWCWWYGDDHSSDNDETFDQLFRKHLKNIYHHLNKESPSYLDSPIKKISAIRPTREPAGKVTPVIDGEITNFYEWLSAGYYDVGRLKGAMHQTETFVKGIYYGFDSKNMHVRLDVNFDMIDNGAKDLSFALVIYHPKQYKAMASYDAGSGKYLLKLFKYEDDNWAFIKNIDTLGVGSIFEATIPFEDISVKPMDEVQFVAVIEKDSQELERWPRGGTINFAAPSEDYFEKQWSV